MRSRGNTQGLQWHRTWYFLSGVVGRSVDYILSYTLLYVVYVCVHVCCMYAYICDCVHIFLCMYEIIHNFKKEREIWARWHLPGTSLILFNIYINNLSKSCFIQSGWGIANPSDDWIRFSKRHGHTVTMSWWFNVTEMNVKSLPEILKKPAC